MDGSSALFQGSFGKEELRQSVRHSEKMDESGDRCQRRECGEKHLMIGDRSTAYWRRRTHLPDCHISERFSAAAVSSDAPFNFRQFGDLGRYSQMHIRTHESFEAMIPTSLLGFDDMYQPSGS